MSFLTLDVKELRRRWMELYVNLMALMSDNPEVDKLLKDFKPGLAETNEEFMALFDKLAKLNEVEGP